MAKRQRFAHRLRPYTRSGRRCPVCNSEWRGHICVTCERNCPLPLPEMETARPNRSPVHAPKFQGKDEKGDEFNKYPLVNSLPDNDATRGLLCEIVLEELQALLKIRRARIASLLPPSFGLDNSEDDTVTEQEIAIRGLMGQVLLGLARDTSNAIARIKAGKLHPLSGWLSRSGRPF